MKKILLAVTGMSPQIITELIYGLAVEQEPPFVPDEVHVITTTEGAERLRLTLLSKQPGWFYQLCKDYNLNGIEFSEDNIHVMEDANGNPMKDIVTPFDNEAAADYIVTLVQRFTRDPNCMLHASIAGGRKTMGYYLGYALSLYGRASDQLSHVLVSEGYESLTDFYYPTPYEKIIHNRDGKPLDSRKAKVWLANIGYVPMRHGIPKALLDGKTTYSETVHAVARAFSEPHVVVDLANKRLICAAGEVKLQPIHLAFYAMFAQRQQEGLSPLLCPLDCADGDVEMGKCFFHFYKKIVGDIGGADRTFKSFTKNGNGSESDVIHGMQKKYFEQYKSCCKSAIRKGLSIERSPYEIVSVGKKPMGYCLDKLEPHQIEFRF